VGLINRTNQIRNKAPHLATRVQDSRLNRPYTAPQSPTLAGLQTPAFELAPHLAQGQPSSSAEAVHTVRIRRPMQQP
jgi:peptidase E